MVGCAGMGGSSDKAYNFFVKNDTALLEQGPQQTTPKETTLRRGNRLRIIEGASSGFVLVETVNGRRGYVSGADIQFDDGTLEGPKDKMWQNQY
jgi:hypothetical protein